MPSFTAFSPPFSEVAIRLPKLEVGDLAGTRPVVIFAEQDQQLAGIADRLTAAGSLQVGAADVPLDSRDQHAHGYGSAPLLHQLEHVVFVLDRSGSMGEPLLGRSRPDKLGTKMEYLVEQLQRLNEDYLPAETQLSLITFDDSTESFSFGEMRSGALSQFKQEVQKLKDRGSTHFAAPLRLCRDILSDNLANRKRLNSEAQPGRSIICFVTDGHDLYSPNDVPAALMQELRDLNATVFVVGMGEGYSMPRIMKLAGYAGASSWSHLPLEKKEMDVFSEQLPEVIKQVLASEHYLQFSVEGSFTEAAAVAPSIRFAPAGSGLIFPGYVREARGIVFERQEDLKISLRAGRAVHDPEGWLRQVPIVDADDPLAPFEEKRHAEDFARNLLLLRAMLNDDANALREMQKIDPNPDQIGAMIDSLQASQRGGGTHDLYSQMTMASVSFSRPPEPQQPNASALYSGNLGPLSAQPPAESLPSLPRQLDPAVYDQQRPRVSDYASVEFTAPDTLKGKQVPLKGIEEGKSYRFGRSSSTDQSIAIRFNDGRISRYHCEIWRENGTYHIMDLGSSNGTAVNGTLIESNKAYCLNDGDVVQLVGVRFRFKLTSK